MKTQMAIGSFQAVRKALALIPRQQPWGGLGVLQSLHVSAENGKACVTATDLQTRVRIEVPALRTTQPGEALFPSELFRGVFKVAGHRKQDECPVTLSAPKDCTNGLSAVGFRSFIKKAPACSIEEYPAFMEPEKKDRRVCSLPESLLAWCLDKILFAVAVEDPRAFLGGACFQGQGDGFRFIGTDGRRLSVASAAFPGNQRYIGEFIIPRKGAEYLRKCLSTDLSGDVVFTVREKEEKQSEGNPPKAIPEILFFRGNDYSGSILLMDAKYPDYISVIPTKTSRRAKINVGLWRTALKELEPMLITGTATLLRFRKGEVELGATSPEEAGFRATIPAEYKSKKPFAIGFNLQGVIEALKHAETETLVLRMTDAVSPMVWDASEGVSGEQRDWTHLIMPMAISEK